MVRALILTLCAAFMTLSRPLMNPPLPRALSCSIIRSVFPIVMNPDE